MSDKKRFALVTGGSGGIGSAICKQLARDGFAVLVHFNSNQTEALNVVNTIVDAGGEAESIQFDISHQEQVKLALDEWQSQQDENAYIAVLVNNAGMSPLYDSLTSVSRELWDKVIGVNLAGPFRLSAVAAERMSAAEGGSIINISSTAAIAPGAAEIPYAAAKAGLNNLTQSMAHSYAPKVRCNCIMPGPFLTDIADAWDENIKNAINAIVPMGRAGQPEEIIGIALYLASDAASYTNGALIKVDGGMAFG